MAARRTNAISIWGLALESCPGSAQYKSITLKASVTTTIEPIRWLLLLPSDRSQTAAFNGSESFPLFRSHHHRIIDHESDLGGAIRIGLAVGPLWAVGC